MDSPKTNYTIQHEDLLLMPYLPEFVPKYHKWMQDEVLLELTGSEKLSLAEEQENQRDWFVDIHKTTFIVFIRHENSDFIDGPSFPADCRGFEMVGDINLFHGKSFESNEAEIMVTIKKYKNRLW
jgi:RimJ/RimL family protein N-acetyltransferase